LYQDYKTVIPDAVLVIQNGKVLESGKVAIPKNAVVIDGKGKFVYPSFIDLYTNIGVEKSEAKQADSKASIFRISLLQRRTMML
jgi:imidazolonepropionase-like amidohydrolase